MSAEFPTLAEVLQRHQWSIIRHTCRCDDPGTHGEWPPHAADAWREACTIRTVAQVDALPIGAVILSLGGSDIGDIYANWADHHLAGLYGPWFRTGYEVPCPGDEVDLPALLLWNPDWRESV